MTYIFEYYGITLTAAVQCEDLKCCELKGPNDAVEAGQKERQSQAAESAFCSLFLIVLAYRRKQEYQQARITLARTQI
jgi:hypothetical protein